MLIWNVIVRILNNHYLTKEALTCKEALAFWALVYLSDILGLHIMNSANQDTSKIIKGCALNQFELKLKLF